MRSFLTVAICAIGVFGAPDTRVTDPPQSPYVLDTNGIPWRRLHLASNLRNNAQDWGGRNKQEHFLEEVRDVYSAIMENRLDVPFETQRTKATVSFAKHNTVNSTQTIYRYNVAIGPEQHPWVGRRMVLDTSFMVLRYFKFTRLTSPSTTAGPDTCAATGDVCSDALYPALNKTCCEGSCERYPGSNRTNICVHGARPSSAATRACGAMLGEVCDDTMFPQSYPRTCCEGTCDRYPGSTRTSICLDGPPVPMGELCYTGDLETYVNGGICAPGSYCMPGEEAVKDRWCMQDDIDIGGACGTTVAEGFHGYCKDGFSCTDGICQTSPSTTAGPDTCAATGDVCSDAMIPSLNKTCCEGSCERYPGSNRTNICVHGLPPGALCYLGDLDMPVADSICASFPGLNHYCLPVEDEAVKDRYCMQYALDIGAACGTTAAEGLHGYCKDGLSCTDGICQAAPATCLAVGEACWDPVQNAPTGEPCCSGRCDAEIVPWLPATNTCLSV